MRTQSFHGSFGWLSVASLVAVLGLAAGCGGEDEPGRGGGVSGSGNNNGSSGSGGGSQGNGGGLDPGLDPGTTPNQDGVVCDAQGQCRCVFDIAVFGRQGQWGAVPGQDGTSAIEAWLNEHSTAAVQSYQQKPAITPEFLDGLQVILLEAMESQQGAGNQWQFSQEEIAHFEAWVRGGGGVIALTGYSDQPAEVDPTHALLAFSGLSYAGLVDAGDTALPAELDGCHYCRGNSVAQAGWNPSHPISASLTAVGAFYGRSVNAPGSAEIVAQDGSRVYGATVQVDEGRVFLFHDEWVTYTSQWTGQGLENDCRTEDSNHDCYNVHPTTAYQVPQFWYNAFRWVGGDRECFDIQVPGIVR